MTLTEFLLARIAEDEGMWTLARDGGMVVVVNGQSAIPPQAWIERQVVECEAKRRIVELGWHHLGNEEYGWGMEEAKRQVLHLLALPYADHEDFKEEWRA